MFIAVCAFAIAGKATFAAEAVEQKGRDAQESGASKVIAKPLRSFRPEEREAIERFRDFYRQYSDGSNSDVSLAVNLDFLHPYAHHLLETIKQGKQDEYIQTLQREVEEALSRKAISANWLVDAHFRYLTLLGPLSPGEQDIFHHVPHHKYLDALLMKDTFGHPVVLNLYAWGSSIDKHGEYYFDVSGSFPYFPEVSNEIIELIDREVAKHLSPPIIYTCLGEGIFPVELLIECLLDETYLVGMPTTKIKDVHGEEETTALGFGFHDLLHYKVDPRRRALHTYMRGLVAEYVKQGGFASDVVPQLVPLVVQKYKLMMEALKVAHKNLEKQEKEPRIGLFLMQHEVPTFSAQFYTFKTPTEMVEAMRSGSEEAYKAVEAWENPDDPLQTSPLTGQSTLTDDQIRDIALQRAQVDGSIYEPLGIYQVKAENESIIYITEEANRKAAKGQWILQNSRIIIKRSPQFIDAVFELRNGAKKVYSYPTLYRKWKNSRASLNMLRYAGRDLSQPALQDVSPEDARELVMGFLTEVRQNLTTTMQQFTERSKAFYGAGEGSYAEKYEKDFRAIDSRLERLLKQSLPQVELPQGTSMTTSTKIPRTSAAEITSSSAAMGARNDGSVDRAGE